MTPILQVRKFREEGPKKIWKMKILRLRKNYYDSLPNCFPLNYLFNGSFIFPLRRFKGKIVAYLWTRC